MIVGVMKSSLTRVLNYTLRNGAQLVGRIPDYYWDDVSGESCEATIIYYPREANDESLYKN